MYDPSDPRASLNPPSANASKATKFAGAEYGMFDRIPPAEDDADGRHWYLRGQNFVLQYSEAASGGAFARTEQPDEYALILPDRDMSAEVSAGGKIIAVPGGSVVFVPAGDSVVRTPDGGRIIRLVTSRSADMAAKCINAQSYRSPRPNLPPFASWPAAAGGPAIRVYPLEVPATPGRFGSIYRCSTFMINAIERYEGPRDTTRLSPHYHDDFEQCSLAVEGSFIHYIRWPWTANLAEWREDESQQCGSPSAVVIPPLAIHTTRAMDAGTNRLIDIFCPPRMDFSTKPGWVLNAADYPMPEAN